MAAHPGKASTAADNAISAVRASPRATSASFQSQSSGDLTSKVFSDATRFPPMKWSGETATDEISTRCEATTARLNGGR